MAWYVSGAKKKQGKDSHSGIRCDARRCNKNVCSDSAVIAPLSLPNEYLVFPACEDPTKTTLSSCRVLTSAPASSALRTSVRYALTARSPFSTTPSGGMIQGLPVRVMTHWLSRVNKSSACSASPTAEKRTCSIGGNRKDMMCEIISNQTTSPSPCHLDPQFRRIHVVSIGLPIAENRARLDGTIAHTLMSVTLCVPGQWRAQPSKYLKGHLSENTPNTKRGPYGECLVEGLVKGRYTQRPAVGIKQSSVGQGQGNLCRVFMERWRAPGP